jgi:hypothetical protein
MQSLTNNTAHPCMAIADPAGTIHQIEYRQYVMNEHQQFAVLDLDREKLPVNVEPVDGIEYSFIGKLSEQSFVFRQQIINSLTIEHWDFPKCQDPEILLITDKRNAHASIAI